MANLKLAKLVLDWRLYPRHEVDDWQVRRLREAIGQGESLPPILVDRASMRIVDGFHRYHAALAVQGEGGEIAANVRSFPSERAIFLEAVRVNARHGIPMEAIDQAATLLRGQDLGIEVEQLAVAMAVPTKKLVSMETHRFGHGPDGPVILKRPMRHFAGRKMTKAQVEANDRLVGMNATYYINRATELIRGKLLDLEDSRICTALDRLRTALREMKKAA